MAKDGLFFKRFASIHPKYHTPVFGTLFTCLVASVMAFFFDVDALASMISIGTLLGMCQVAAVRVVLLDSHHANQQLFCHVMSITAAQPLPSSALEWWSCDWISPRTVTNQSSIHRYV